MPTFSSTDQQMPGNVLLAKLGITGYNGITATIDGTTNTQLDIAVSSPFALLANGDYLDTQLVAATVTGLSTNGTYSLWLDESTDGKHTPSWSVSASAPSTNAIAVATVVVSGAVLNSVTMLPKGINLGADAAPSFNTTTQTGAPSAGGGTALPATPALYFSATINGVARKVAAY